MKKPFVLLAMCLATTPLLAHNVTWEPNPMVVNTGQHYWGQTIGVIYVTHLAGEACIVNVTINSPQGSSGNAIDFAGGNEGLDVTAFIKDTWELDFFEGGG